MKAKIPCMVCGADSIGINFSVRTCKPCASFYRRCIAERKHYTCKNNNQCQIDQEQRQQCRACRLNKCKNVGMSNEIRDNPPICAIPSLPVTPTENLQFEQKYPILTELLEAWNTFQTSQKSLLKIVHPQTTNNSGELQVITKLEYERLEVGMASLLLSMLNEKFESFQKLNEQNRNQVYKRFCIRLFYLHIIFMTSIIYPDDVDDRIVLYNVFYLSIPTWDQFFKNCDISQVNIEEIKNVWKTSYEKILKIKRHFVKLQIREIEAVFLTGVLYYDEIDDIEQMDENIEQLFNQLKREMFDNLIENYGVDDGIPRMAEIMKFVSDINKTCVYSTESMILCNMILPKAIHINTWLTVDEDHRPV